MKLSEAGGGGAVVDVAGETWRIPPFPMAEVIAWAAEIDAKREADFRKAAEAIGDGERRFHHLNAYTWRAASVFDVQDAAALTPAGITRVVNYCLPRATVTARGGQPVSEAVSADAAAAVAEANTPESLCLLARKLVGLADPPAPKPKEAKETKADGESPLTPTSATTQPPPSNG